MISILIAFISLYIGYKLGLRSGKIQILRDYVKENVNKIYPLLYSEIKQKTEELDNFLDKPFELSYNFPNLEKIYNSGLIGFIEKHHPLLSEKIDVFRKDVLSKYEKLYNILRKQVITNITSSWTSYLKDECRKSNVDLITLRLDDFVSELISVVSDNLVLPLLFRYEKNKKVYEPIIRSHLNRAFDTWGIPIYGNDREKVIQELLIRAEPDIKNIFEYYQKLIKINDKLTKKELLPLIKRYIGDPLIK